MPRHLHGPIAMTILNAGTDSTGYTVQSALGSITGTIVFAPATLPETVTVQIAHIDNPQAADWKTLTWQPAAVDIAFVAGKAMNIPLVAGFRALRLHATAPVAADRVFQTIFQIDGDYEL